MIIVMMDADNSTSDAVVFTLPLKEDDKASPMESPCRKKVTSPPGTHRVIILDEADSMTYGAQQALRRKMKIYINSTRFALACNTSAKTIELFQLTT
nr:replication factor C subunit 2 [Tanacetum cinerariifolium]